MSEISSAISNLSKAMVNEGIDPRGDLPIELFEFSTTLRPFINVDLLVLNESNQILLSWRDDRHYGLGWQIPGGIVRMMETLDDRIQKTALREIGCQVEYDNNPIAVYENIIRDHRVELDNQLERAHNIALLYKCMVPKGYIIDNKGKKQNEEGFLKWFDKFPDNLLECHKVLCNYPDLKLFF